MKAHGGGAVGGCEHGDHDAVDIGDRARELEVAERVGHGVEEQHLAGTSGRFDRRPPVAVRCALGRGQDADAAAAQPVVERGHVADGEFIADPAVSSHRQVSEHGRLLDEPDEGGVPTAGRGEQRRARAERLNGAPAVRQLNRHLARFDTLIAEKVRPVRKRTLEIGHGKRAALDAAVRIEHVTPTFADLLPAFFCF